MTVTRRSESDSNDDLLRAWTVLITPHLATNASRVTTSVRAVGESLLASWDEPFRRYDDLDHLRYVLAVVEDLAAHATDPDAVRIAA